MPLKDDALEPPQVNDEDKLGGFSRSESCSSFLRWDIVRFSEIGVPGCEINSSDSWISAAVKVSKVGSTSDGSELCCFFGSSVRFNLPLAPSFGFASAKATKAT